MGEWILGVGYVASSLWRVVDGEPLLRDSEVTAMDIYRLLETCEYPLS